MGEHTFQRRCFNWLGEMLSGSGESPANTTMRSRAFLEEALELVQAVNKMSAADAHKLVDIVFARPPGEIEQELGGVLLTMMSLAEATGNDAMTCGENEIRRAYAKIDVIRIKHREKLANWKKKK